MQPTKFPERLDVGYRRTRTDKDNPKVFGLKKWKKNKPSTDVEAATAEQDEGSCA